ncbi:MAG: hypothetical protein N2595_10045 [bacterium]|nr:hypothetical protein [bacterium]
MKFPAVVMYAHFLSLTAFAQFHRAWDTSLVTTSQPPGTGYAVWRSPEPAPTDADEYVCTSALHAVGYLLNYPTVVDAGIVTYATNTGPAISFPHTLLNHTVTQAITSPLYAWYTLHFLATLHTDGYLVVELSNYQSYGGSPPNTSTPLPSRLEMHGQLTNGLGTALTAVPETSWWTLLLSLISRLLARRPTTFRK